MNKLKIDNSIENNLDSKMDCSSNNINIDNDNENSNENSIENSNENSNENDSNNLKNMKLKENNISNKQEEDKNEPEPVIYKQKSKSSNKIIKLNLNNDSNNSKDNNNSNDTNGSHNSHNDGDKSPNFCHFYNQINNYKQSKNDEKLKLKNSTILEIKNEDNLNSRSNTLKKEKSERIIFGEGYFSNFNHNEYLRTIDNNDEEQAANYIHEFWKALAITNECMVKEEKGEIRYMGTSPDDLELVRAAMNQGYKLVDTSINSKTIRIAGKDYTFEILKVLGFSSERKRMSIIIKDRFGIKLYSKGADSEISKRLSKKSFDSESFKIISNGLLDFQEKV
jgi:hypothetical protein